MFPTMAKRYEGCIDAACGWKEGIIATPGESVVATCHRGG